MSSILTEFEQQGFKKISGEKKNKQRNEQLWTLDYTLVLQTRSSPKHKFFFLFLSESIGFPSKMMPCKLKTQLHLSWSWTFV
jgi:hypothetical protein